MAKEVCVYYLQHSGFAVKIGEKLLVFDYYRDVKGIVEALLPSIREMYIFSSHAHYDHFDAKIAAFSKSATKYFLSSDIKAVPDARKMPPDKTIYLGEYATYEDASIRVTTYSSTDAGTCFLVETGGAAIFHAGDFNWWHWKGDTERNNKFARNGFIKQLKKMAGMRADIAFFPTDARLEEYASLGAREFCRACDIGYLIGMHAQGVSWRPEEDFFNGIKEIPTWCPTTPGEKRIITIGR